jgi:2-polyprenyl-6-methoxyphenol hydroxylase-like FAD-dependent oxidoreductase
VSVERWSPGRRAGVIPLSRGRIYVYLVKSARQGTPGPESNSPDSVRNHFGGIDAVLDAVLDRLDDTVAINHDDLCEREGADFGAGRVVLIGDAAHPMTPNAGQGAGTAIEDAGVLALLLPDYAGRLEELPEALAGRCSERVCSIQKLAWRVGQVAHWRNPVARYVRDFAMRAIPQSIAHKQARALWKPGIEIARELRDSGHFG